MKNPYEVLGVSMDASEAEIKSAFRRRAKATHPDLNDENPQLTKQFREVAEAYTAVKVGAIKPYGSGA